MGKHRRAEHNTEGEGFLEELRHSEQIGGRWQSGEEHFKQGHRQGEDV